MLQQQLQGIMAQREAVGAQILEIKKALDELDKSKESEVFKIAGPILIKSPKASVLKDLTEKDEVFGIRFKSMEKEEKRIKLKIEDMRERLVKGMSGPVGG